MLTKQDFNEATNATKMTKFKNSNKIHQSITIRILALWKDGITILHNNHSTACLIDREIQMMLGLGKELRPDKKNNSAYNCNCKVAHNMGLHRGLLAVDLEDENQWDELAKQPKIAGTDIRYPHHSIIQPVVPRYINHHHPYQRTYQPANQQQPVHHHRQNL